MMRRVVSPAPWIILPLIATACSAPLHQEAPADLIVTNAAIYTGDPRQPWAEALALRVGRLAHVGEHAKSHPDAPWILGGGWEMPLFAEGTPGRLAVVDLPGILDAYTMGGAFVNFEENDSGSLTPGKYADFILLDTNILTIPTARIHEAKVLWTVMEGSEVYRAPEL